MIHLLSMHEEDPQIHSTPLSLISNLDVRESTKKPGPFQGNSLSDQMLFEDEEKEMQPMGNIFFSGAPEDLKKSLSFNNSSSATFHNEEEVNES